MFYKDTLIIYKCINNLAPSYLSNNFRKRSELHEHPMRDQELLNIPLFRTATGKRTFHYRVVKIWNELEDELKLIPTLGNFKRKLKSHVLDKFHLSSYLCILDFLVYMYSSYVRICNLLSVVNKFLKSLGNIR